PPPARGCAAASPRARARRTHRSSSPAAPAPRPGRAARAVASRAPPADGRHDACPASCHVPDGAFRPLMPRGKRPAVAGGSMRTGRAFLAGLTLALAAGCGSAKVELAAAPRAQPPPPAPAPAPAPTPQPVAAEGGDAVLEGDRIKIARNIFYDVDKDEIR